MRDGGCKLSRDEGPGVGDLAQHGARDGGDPETGEWAVSRDLPSAYYKSFRKWRNENSSH